MTHGIGDYLLPRLDVVCAVLLGCAVFMLAPLSAISSSLNIEGVWVNGDADGWIELGITNGELRGRIIGSPGDPDNQKPSRNDVENPDAKLRHRPLRGLFILYGFRSDGDGHWTGGRVYDPNSGHTYRGTITQLDADTLKLRGYVGITWFGRTETWKRRPDSL